MILGKLDRQPGDPAASNALARLISGGEGSGDDSSRGRSAGEKGCLVLNPFSFARRLLVETDALENPPATDDVVRFSDKQGSIVQAVVDVPAAGFAWFTGDALASGKAKSSTPLVAENTLRNEYFEIVINSTTGGIHSIREYKRRGALASQQIVFCPDDGLPREDDPERPLRFSVMAADEVEVTQSTAVVGEIASRGRLLDRGGNLLAKFQQRVRVQRGSRVAKIEIELDPEALPGKYPWRSYYASRFAWADMADDVHRCCNWTTQLTTARRIVSSCFVDLRGRLRRTTILTGGLSMHRQVGPHESSIRCWSSTAKRPGRSTWASGSN